MQECYYIDGTEKVFPINRLDDDDGGYSILGDEGIICDTEGIKFVKGDDMRVEDDNDIPFLGYYWEWYQWNIIYDDDDVTKLPISDSYNGIYGLKLRVVDNL